MKKVCPAQAARKNTTTPGQLCNKGDRASERKASIESS
jgi:hypothetical protein